MTDPHEADLETILQDLVDDGLIQVRGEGNSSPVYVLTPKGRQFYATLASGPEPPERSGSDKTYSERDGDGLPEERCAPSDLEPPQEDDG